METLKLKNKSKGITLIALVITIVILLILAGISIATLGGDNGLFGRAKEAKEKSTIGQAQEDITNILNEWRIEQTTGKMTLQEFLNEKLSEKSIDKLEPGDTEGTTIIVRKGYMVIVDEQGEILENIQKFGPRPQISNMVITLEDGKTVPSEYSQKSGTKLQINFDAKIEGGEIINITPQLPYVTNGTEKKVSFIILGKINGNEVEKKYEVKLDNKYEIIYESKDLISAIETNDIQEGIAKIQVSNQLYNIRMYCFNDSQVWDADKTFGTQEDVATSNSYATNMVVIKIKGDLTINEGVTVRPYYTAYGGPKGLLLYVTGTLTNNGTIDNSHGAKAIGENVYLWQNEDETFEYVPAVGGIGGSSFKVDRSYTYFKAFGKAGTDGTGRQTGGRRNWIK